MLHNSACLKALELEILRHVPRLEQTRSWRTAVGVAALLMSWKVKLAAEAALLVPILEIKAAEGSGSDEAWELAKRAAALKALIAPVGAGSASRYSWQLRRLYREAYLDLPRLPLVLLMMADHQNRVAEACGADDRMATSETQALAEQTAQVFVPLAEMLGIWCLRRCWLDFSMRVLHPNKYQDVQALIGKPDDYSLSQFSQVLSEKADRPTGKQLTEKRPAGTGPAGRGPTLKMWLATKAEAYYELQNDLQSKFDKVGIPGYTILPIPLYAGVAVRRLDAGDVKDAIVPWLRIRLVCQTDDDCYRTLQVIHGLGKSLTTRYSNRFGDLIASPKWNGYRAIHTALHYARRGRLSLAVEFRILTIKMHFLNEWGVIAALHRRPDHFKDIRAWWNGLELGKGRSRLNSEDPDIGRHEALQETIKQLRDHDLDSRTAKADPHGGLARIYAFTPKGEVYRLPERSTVLDFAFAIHSDVGRQATRIEVNGRPVPFGEQFANGDMIRVETDPYGPGPDHWWLNCLESADARRLVRQTLSSQARRIHVGRALLEQALLQRLEKHRQKDRFNFPVTTQMLDAFALGAADRRGLTSPIALYARVLADSQEEGQLAGVLANELIEEELKALVVGPDNTTRVVLRMCPQCRPVLDVPIIGVRPAGHPGELYVHRKNSAQCLTPVVRESQLPLEWRNRLSGVREVINLNVRGDDRRDFMQDVLGALTRLPVVKDIRRSYSEPNATGMEINVAIEIQSKEALLDIDQAVRSVRGVRWLFILPATPSQQVNELSWVVGHNPFGLSDRLHPSMFYDRTEATNQILEWLRRPGDHRLWVSGPYRVGKTCLVRYIEDHELGKNNPVAMPVYVDCQRLATPDFGDFSELLIHEIYLKLGQEVPDRPDTNLFSWLCDGVRKAVVAAGNIPLLLILDEFAAPSADPAQAMASRSMFRQLRAVMVELREVFWLVIVPDLACLHPEQQATIGPFLLEFPPPCRVDHFDDSWARRLVTEPILRYGLSLPEGRNENGQTENWRNQNFVDRLIWLTGGNPYFLQLLCLSLVNRVRAARREYITHQDLDLEVARLVSEGGIYFSHFGSGLTQGGDALVRDVAEAAADGGWADWEKVSRRHPGGKAMVDDLVRQGILSRRSGPAGGAQVSIRIGLVYEWSLHRLASRPIE